MIPAGIVLHYFIALGWAIVYLFAYPHISFLRKNIFLSGLVYGLFAWGVMTFIFIPLRFLQPPPFSPKWWWLIFAAFHCFCIGLPDSIVIGRYYRQMTPTEKESTGI